MKIELGKKIGDGPATAMPMHESDRMSYPSLHFVHDKAIDLPAEGTATIKFRRTMATHDTTDPKNPVHRHEIEVHSIDVHPGKKEDGMVSMKDAFKQALDKGMMSKKDAEDAAEGNDSGNPEG